MLVAVIGDSNAVRFGERLRGQDTGVSLLARNGATTAEARSQLKKAAPGQTIFLIVGTNDFSPTAAMHLLQKLCDDAEADGHPVMVLKPVFKRDEQFAIRRQHVVSSPQQLSVFRNDSRVIDIGDYSYIDYIDNLHLTDQCLDKIVQAGLLLL